MNEPDFGETLITALRGLSQRPLTNRKELAACRAEAERIERSLTPEQADTIPQFIWHYLEDADIRMRNPGYRADQERKLAHALRQLDPRAHKLTPRR